MEYIHGVKRYFVEFQNSRLREELKRLGISLAAAARAIGEQSPQRLRDIAAGRQRPPADLIGKLGRLGVDMTYILTGIKAEPYELERVTSMLRVTAGIEPDGGPLTEKAYAAATEMALQNTKREQALLANYRASSNEGKRALETAAKVMAQQATGDKTKGT